MKTCIKCADQKEASEFPARGGTCKVCAALYNKRYREENQNQIREQRKDYYYGGGYDKQSTRKTWYGMLLRCDGKTERKDYFDRGITVCDRWRTFENFLSDMGEKPKGLTLERIDNDGNYEPSNCKWATMAEQSRNKRTTLRIPHEGEIKCGRDVARDLGISENAIYKRIEKGMTPEEAITTPVKPKERFIEFNGQRKCIKDWARSIGMKYETLIRRIDAGWPVEKALTTPTRTLH